MVPPSSSHSLTRRNVFTLGAGIATGALAGCLSRSERAAADQSPTERSDEPSQSESWPQFGADARNTGYTPGVTGPASNAEVAWKYDVGTPSMNTSPVAANGTVYVPGSGDPGLVHAVDIESGEQEWQFEPAGYCTATPALVDDTLYVGTWGRRFYALDTATGSPRWSRRFGQRFGSSSPAVVDETIYVGTYGDAPLTATGSEDTETVESCTFLALDTASGDTRWQYRKFSGQIGINSSPAVADGRVYFGAEDGLYALDADSGSEVWVREIPTQRDASPAVVDGTVYYGTELGSDGETPAQVWALDAATGETVWTAGIDDQSLRTSPAATDGTVYVAASSARVCALGGSGNCSGVTRGRLYALDAESGDQQWTATIKTDTRSSPAVADGTVYVGCKNGVSAVTTDGENAWRVNFGSLLSEPPYVESSPAVVDGYVFVGASDGRLRAIK